MLSVLLAKLFTATVTQIVGGTVLNEDWLKAHNLPLAGPLEKGLDAAKDLFKDALPDLAKRLFPEETDLAQWIADDSLALLVARTAAALAQEVAAEQDEGATRKAFEALARALADSSAAWRSEVEGLLRPADLQAATVAQFGGGEGVPVSPLSVDDWTAVLRRVVPEAPRAAWGLFPQATLSEAHLRLVAERLHDRFLASLPIALAKEENAIAYRRVLVATMGDGFSRLLAAVAEGGRDVAGIRAALARLTAPHARQSLPPGSPYAFQNRLVGFQGREAEFDRARRFLADGRPFLWWRLTGVAGSGKSRFAQEVVDRARFAGWEAVWINWKTEGKEANAAPWTAWEPERPVLVVFDDALDHAERLAQILSVMGDRARDDWTEGDHRVRFLALARESRPVRWNALPNAASSEEIRENLYVEPGDDAPGSFASAKPELFGPRTALDLAPLEPLDLRRIVEAAWDAAAPPDRTLAPAEVDALLASLAEGPGLLHPLYAQIAAEALARDGVASLDREGFVEYVVKREEERWTHDGVPLSYANLARSAASGRASTPSPRPPRSASRRSARTPCSRGRSCPSSPNRPSASGAATTPPMPWSVSSNPISWVNCTPFGGCAASRSRATGSRGGRRRPSGTARSP